MSQTNLAANSGKFDDLASRQGEDPGGVDGGPGRGHGKEKKIGHRRVTHEGTVTYKKKSTSELQLAIQLGIAHSVGKMLPQRDLLLKDFGVVETVEFPSDGSKFTPAHSLSEFKFKTYAPYAFRFFRALFDVDKTEFLQSLCTRELRELSNPGASGSIFYITQDDEFIIKTVQHKEGAFLQKLLPEYYMNLTQNKYTLLPKYYGLYCYMCGGKNIRFVVMNNLLPSSIPIHEKYDLKGSTYKRSASSKERAKSSPTLKDLDFRELHPEGIMIEEFDALKKTIERDCRVLESFRIMDYSLLLGVFNVGKAKIEHTTTTAASETLTTVLTKENPGACSTVESPGASTNNASSSTPYTGPTRGRSIKRIATNTTAMEALQGAATQAAVPDKEAEDLPEDMPPGGVPARNSRGEKLLLYIGIIDILQNFRLLKKMEHTMKSIVHDADSISVHNPAFYANRFQAFLLDLVFHKMPAPTAMMAIKHGPSRKKVFRSRANTKEAEQSDAEEKVGEQPRKVSIVSTVSDSTDASQTGNPPIRTRRTSAPARDSLREEEEEEEEEPEIEATYL